jgi:hypothetical protein
VADGDPRRLELARALVAEKIVARVDVVNPEAVGARVALADVALQERGVVDERFAAAIGEAALGHGLPTRLTTARWLHRGLSATSGGGGLRIYDSIVPSVETVGAMLMRMGI